MLHIYSLTENGKRLARSTSAPDNPTYRVIFWIDKVGSATPEGIAEHARVGKGELGTILRRLRFSGVIKEDTLTEVTV